MRVTIDSLDGRGAIDYSDQVVQGGAITVTRVLNKPSRCRMTVLAGSGVPQRLSRVVVSDESATVLFTGYLTMEPTAIYAGADSQGAVYLYELEAISDEWLLDKQGLRVSFESFAVSGAALLTGLTNRLDTQHFTTTGPGTMFPVGRFSIRSNRSWSEVVRELGRATGSSYRVLAGEVEMVPLGSVQHTFQEADGTLNEAGLKVESKRELVNDVILSGGMEPGAVMTDIFVGDGSTSSFTLSMAPYKGASPKQAEIVADDFQAPVLDPQQWLVADAGGHLHIGGGGLRLTGGDGFDGSTTLTATGSVELGGSLLLEASGVLLSQGSDGVVLGLYSGAVNRGDCIAGFDIRQTNGATTVGCLLDGEAAGTQLTMQTGHLYTLRLHLHAAEIQRERQSFVVMAGGTLRLFGGGSVDSPLDAVFEVRDLDMSLNTTGQVLFRGRLESSPTSATFAAVNSTHLMGSIASIGVRRAVGAWVQSKPVQGGPEIRLEGGAGMGADFTLSGANELRFYPHRVPDVGEQITVQYRTSQRAVARVQSIDSIASEAQTGLPGMASWRGSVVMPVAQSAEDCAAAAEAVLAVSTSRSEAVRGVYEDENLSDVWPGALLHFESASGTTTALAREVELSDQMGVPETIRTRITFANEWAESEGLTLSTAFPADAGIPLVVAQGMPPCLTRLTVVSVSAGTVLLDTGTDAPAGGGFEIRRFDGGFGAGDSDDLVLRTAARSITLPRTAQIERFYVKPYDGSTPPMYARLSSAVMLDVPVN